MRAALHLVSRVQRAPQLWRGAAASLPNHPRRSRQCRVALSYFGGAGVARLSSCLRGRGLLLEVAVESEVAR